MNTNYFAGCATVAELKKLYRQLALRWHPDRDGGDTRTMQEINAQYHAALEHMDGRTERGTDGRDHTYHYNRTVEQATMDKLAELLRLRLPNVDVWLIGSWLWVMGETKPVKDQLKKAGLWWHNERQAWYWKPPESGKWRYNSHVDFNGLAATYGAKLYRPEDDEPTSKQRTQQRTAGVLA